MGRVKEFFLGKDDVEPEMATDSTPGGYGLSIKDRYHTQIIDGFHVSGIPVGNLTRESVSGYTPLRRAVSLISGSAAQIITNGMVRIESSVGGKRLTPTALEHNVLTQLSETLDYGENTSRMMIEDIFCDYCLNGNGLMRVDRSISSSKLSRLRVEGAYTDMTSQGEVYVTTGADGRRIVTAATDVIHIRWPDIEGSNSVRSRRMNRSRFAASPVKKMFIPLRLALLAENNLIGFMGDNRPEVSVSFSDQASLGLKPEQRKEVAENVQTQWEKYNKAVVAFGGKVETMVLNPSDYVPNEIREFQVRDTCRVYGCPPLLLGEHADRLPGTMAAEVAFHFYKFGLRHHIARMMEPFSLRLLRGGKKFAVDPTDFLRGDIKTADALNAMMGGGQGGKRTASEQETRRALGLPGDADPNDTFAESSPNGANANPSGKEKPGD